MWRSPTAARVFGRRPDLSVRARGLGPKSSTALRREDIEWADLIFVMEHSHASRLRDGYRDPLAETLVHVLDIRDHYRFMDPDLVELLEERVEPLLEQAQR